MAANKVGTWYATGLSPLAPAFWNTQATVLPFAGIAGIHCLPRASSEVESKARTNAAVAAEREETTAHYDGPPATPSPPATAEQHREEPSSIPAVVGGYRLLRELGRGGMGAVFEAEDSSAGRHVAVKLISPDSTTSPEAVERFRREGRLASVIAHPRCVFVLAADEDAGRPYIVMELMPGATLKDLIEQQGARPPQEAVAKILDVIDGLQEAHRLGVVHRDVKPSNCFLEADGRVKIGDFGLSKSLQLEGHLTRTGSFVGTPLFASPEQVRGETVDLQTDVYSVAATLYFLLTGRAPFQSKDTTIALVRIAADPAPSMQLATTGITTGARRGRVARPGARPAQALARPGRVPEPPCFLSCRACKRPRR